MSAPPTPDEFAKAADRLEDDKRSFSETISEAARLLRWAGEYQAWVLGDGPLPEDPVVDTDARLADLERDVRILHHFRRVHHTSIDNLRARIDALIDRVDDATGDA